MRARASTPLPAPRIVLPTGCPQRGAVERQTYGFKETLEELDLLVHGVHLGLKLHLIGISCIHILKDSPATPWSLPAQPRRQQLPQPGCPAQVCGHLLLFEGPMEKETKEHPETLLHQ